MARILVIDDTPANLALAEKLLAAAGHEALSAGTATAGVSLAAGALPDLVLMDLGLPDMDGTEALTNLRSNPRTSHLRVVAFTAFAMTADRERALAAGFDGYLSKPIRFATFATDVAELLA